MIVLKLHISTLCDFRAGLYVRREGDVLRGLILYHANLKRSKKETKLVARKISLMVAIKIKIRRKKREVERSRR